MCKQWKQETKPYYPLLLLSSLLLKLKLGYLTPCSRVLVKKLHAGIHNVLVNPHRESSHTDPFLPQNKDTGYLCDLLQPCLVKERIQVLSSLWFCLKTLGMCHNMIKSPALQRCSLMNCKGIQILKWKKERNSLRDTHDYKKLLQLSVVLGGYSLLLMLYILQYILSVLDEQPCWSFLANKGKNSVRAALLALHHHWNAATSRHKLLHAWRTERKAKPNPHPFESWEMWCKINSDYPARTSILCSVTCHPREFLGPCLVWVCCWSEIAAMSR